MSCIGLKVNCYGEYVGDEQKEEIEDGQRENDCLHHNLVEIGGSLNDDHEKFEFVGEVYSHLTFIMMLL